MSSIDRFGDVDAGQLLPEKRTGKAAANIEEAEEQFKGTSWNKRAIGRLERWNAALDQKMPPHALQKKLDKLGDSIQEMLDTHQAFVPVRELNRWLDKEHIGPWPKRMALFLAKVPIRVARNITTLVYNIIKGLCYGFVHPIKGMGYAAQFVIRCIHALTQPETYTKIGAGVIGASLGQILMTGGFGIHAYVGLGIGGTLLIGGLTIGAIKSAVKADAHHRIQAVGKNLWTQVKSIPEAMLTGFIFGVIFGAIMKSLHHQPPPKHVNFPTDSSQAQTYANQYIIQHHLPPPSSVTFTKLGQVIITWKDASLQGLQFQPSVHAIGSQIPQSYSIVMNSPLGTDQIVTSYWLEGIYPKSSPLHAVTWSNTTTSLTQPMTIPVPAVSATAAQTAGLTAGGLASGGAAAALTVRTNSPPQPTIEEPIADRREQIKREIAKAEEQRDYLIEVNVRLTNEMQQVWDRVRRTPKNKDIIANAIQEIDKSIQDVEKKISKGKVSSVDKGKQTSLKQFKAELESARTSELFNREEISDFMYKQLASIRNKAQDELQELEFKIAHNKSELGQLRAKKKPNKGK